VADGFVREEDRGRRGVVGVKRKGAASIRRRAGIRCSAAKRERRAVPDFGDAKARAGNDAASGDARRCDIHVSNCRSKLWRG